MRPQIGAGLHDDHQTLDLIMVSGMQQQMNSFSLAPRGIASHLGDLCLIDGMKFIDIAHSNGLLDFPATRVSF
jgi:hypothetical protein